MTARFSFWFCLASLLSAQALAQDNTILDSAWARYASIKNLNGIDSSAVGAAIRGIGGKKDTAGVAMTANVNAARNVDSLRAIVRENLRLGWADTTAMFAWMKSQLTLKLGWSDSTAFLAYAKSLIAGKQNALSFGSNDGTYLAHDGAFRAPSGGGTWGSITGTLSNQSDLTTALGGKQAAGTYIVPSDTTLIHNEIVAGLNGVAHQPDRTVGLRPSGHAHGRSGQAAARADLDEHPVRVAEQGFQFVGEPHGGPDVLCPALRVRCLFVGHQGAGHVGQHGDSRRVQRQRGQVLGERL